MKSGSLNLLEPSGPVKACNGIALPILCILVLKAGEWSDSDPGYFRYAKKALNIHCMEGLDMINPQPLFIAILKQYTCTPHIAGSAFCQYCPEFKTWSLAL
jgi:hypothetical protein